MINKYVKLPIPVEAVQYTGTHDNLLLLSEFSNDILIDDRGNISVETLEGIMKPRLLDYVIKAPTGETWFVKKDIFEQTYKEVK